MKPNLWPSLGYQDAAAAVRLLIQGLGFDELAHHAGTQPGQITQAVMRWQDGGLITVHSAEPNAAGCANLDGHPPIGIYLYTDDPDTLVSPCHHGSFGWTTR